MTPARRITWTLFATQSLGSAGFLISSTITPIVGAALSGRARWAGVPAAAYWVGGAAGALLWGRLMDALGRRPTLALGLAVGTVGAGIASAAIVAGSFLVFTGGLAMMGSAHTAVQLARFVAAEVHPKAQRGRAIATVVMGGTVGGVAGPLLVAPMAAVALTLGLPELAGPYWASMAVFTLAALVVVSLLHPNPRTLALQIEREAAGPGPLEPARSTGLILRDSRVAAAMASMVLAQGVMSMLMVISSLHMRQHAHTLGAISAATSSHVLGMFAFSMVSGYLADRWGRGPLIATGGVLLISAGIAATASVAFVPMAAMLLVLGLGWNLCYVGGSALLSDRLHQSERARIQSINDACLTAASAIGSLLSGIVFAEVGFAVMGIAAAAVALVPLGLGWGQVRASRAMSRAA